ncbi:MULTISPECIES: DNA-deoxyinosine glycosylase [unclassified Methanosarcina]|uniref:DNA-deoxyinosine glycosylase n=1 Tax=unclassified Methanosarcina TaxID=2644672 RepID=UPI000615E381|nr:MULTISPECIES: DNA-deoxyinosine glycosylase [unclassified Methanosarcina]AKB17186.1 G:T/U mismatch-specific uracil/thymine DNA-glycosylase [Methanosarcina sp. WWM596]AKB20591.1 G:T/U mismatch-specific uracil/thymine DNA-glycosylase [Methanosarcina sp. WH1]
MIKRGFTPFLDENTRILILGSLPSDESIRKQQYYGNPGNDFWRLVGRAIGENLQNMAYEKKLEVLKSNGIGLWDVFHAGSREGSQDSRIRDEEINDFSSLKEIVPELKLVCFNGKKAGEYEPLLRGMGYQTKVLPSSSGANRRFSKNRELEWEVVFKY